MILLIDNFDSFVNNLARYIRELGFPTKVVRCNEITLEEIEALKPSHIILSPGPCTPYEAGICIPLIQYFVSSVPILGICLGHQAIVCAEGGTLKRAEYPIHGKPDNIHHNGEGVFKGLENPLTVGRYHSLIVDRDTLPDCFIIDATVLNGEIMAIRHKEYPLVGLQFHPESILTYNGHTMLENFINL